MNSAGPHSNDQCPYEARATVHTSTASVGAGRASLGSVWLLGPAPPTLLCESLKPTALARPSADCPRRDGNRVVGLLGAAEERTDVRSLTDPVVPPSGPYNCHCYHGRVNLLCVTDSGIFQN